MTIVMLNEFGHLFVISFPKRKKLLCKINKLSCRKKLLFVHIIKDISDDNGSIIFNVLVNIIMSLCILKFDVPYFYI